MGIPPTRFRQLPARVLRRDAPAHHDRARPRAEARFVVADEPTTALDVLVEAQILSILADLKRNFDTSLLLITHNLGIVAEACDRVAVMYAGRIVEEGTVREVFSGPTHPYTRELMRSTISLSTTRTALHPWRAARSRRPAVGVPLSTHAVRARCGSAEHTSQSGSRSAEGSSPNAGCTGRT